jgi:hypothetical protein
MLEQGVALENVQRLAKTCPVLYLFTAMGPPEICPLKISLNKRGRFGYRKIEGDSMLYLLIALSAVIALVLVTCNVQAQHVYQVVKG